jgi:hypothetical protein
VCGNTSTELVVVGLEGFVSQVWRADLSERIGEDLDEKALIRDGRRPRDFEGAFLSPDGALLAVKTSFYDPPNLQLAWYSLWDVNTGVPIGGRVEFADDGLSTKLPVPDVALFSRDGDVVAFASGCAQEKCQVVRSIELRVPDEFRAGLPRIAEAIAGVRYEPRGALVSVPDADRRSELELLLPR